MDLGAHEIQAKQFNDAWRGYNQEEVDDFLDKVAEAIDQAQRENRALHARVRELDQVLATSRDTEDMLKKTLITAQQAAEEAIASAKAKAEQLIEEAQAHATRAHDEAQDHVRSVEDQMRMRQMEAERDQASRRREIDERVARLQAQEAELTTKLRSFLQDHLAALDALATEPPGAPVSSDQGANDRAGGFEPSRPEGAEPPGNEAPTVTLPDTLETPQVERRGVRGLFGRDPSNPNPAS